MRCDSAFLCSRFSGGIAEIRRKWERAIFLVGRGNGETVELTLSHHSHSHLCACLKSYSDKPLAIRRVLILKIDVIKVLVKT